MRINNRKDLAIDFAADYTSAAFTLMHLTGYSITASVASGTPVGTIKLQACNNAFADNVGVGVYEDPDARWVDVRGSSNAINSTTDVMWNYDGTNYQAVRYVYTSTSGTGTVNVYLNAKGPQS